MKYCTHCLLPDSKPDLFFNKKGVCNACVNYEKRKSVSWRKRKLELEKILHRYRNTKGNNWDCIIPVSGGKDSHYQVIRMLEFGMHPLCVTATTCDLSTIGKSNIENIKKLGVDLIEFSPMKNVRAVLNQIGLKQVGDISWPEHVSIFTIPIRIAVAFNIPLVIWGENPQNEYGGPASALKNNVLTRQWLEEFGGLNGLRVSDLIGIESLSQKDLVAYTYPSDKELVKIGVTGLFLGFYIPWDGYTNALIAQNYGFSTAQNIVEGSSVNYENLDNYQTGIHDYFKYLKFGFGRATDIISLHIRRRRITRSEGVKLVRMHDGLFPWTYLGKSIEDILKPIGVSLSEFVQICDQFTNRKLFAVDSKGNLIKDKNGNLSKLIYPEP